MAPRPLGSHWRGTSNTTPCAEHFDTRLFRDAGVSRENKSVACFSVSALINLHPAFVWRSVWSFGIERITENTRFKLGLVRLPNTLFMADVRMNGAALHFANVANEGWNKIVTHTTHRSAQRNPLQPNGQTETLELYVLNICAMTILSGESWSEANGLQGKNEQVSDDCNPKKTGPKERTGSTDFCGSFHESSQRLSQQPARNERKLSHETMDTGLIDNHHWVLSRKTLIRHIFVPKRAIEKTTISCFVEN